MIREKTIIRQMSRNNIKFLTIVYLIGFILTLQHNNVSASGMKTNKNLLILGDSLSAGYGIAQGKNWTDLLQKKMSENNIQIINASISGDTTANGLNRLNIALDKFKPDWVLIELGANDGLRGLSIKHIRKNLEQLIQACLAADSKVLLMNISIPPNYGKKYTQAFANIYNDLIKKYSLTAIPFLLETIALRAELMQQDGLHPNEKAQIEISNNMWHILKPLILDPQNY